MQFNPHAHQLPPTRPMPSLSFADLIDATTRLTDILAQETEHLVAMRVKDIVPLQEEKLRLTKLLETYRMMLASDPSIVQSATPAMREELLLLTDDLAFTIEENFRHTSVARAVNQRVMQAVMDVMHESHRPGTYDRQGQAALSPDLALSMNLNEKA